MFWLSLWLFAMCILLSIVTRWWLGDSVRFSRVIGYIMPWLIVMLMSGVFSACLAKHWLLAVAMSIPLLYICISYSPLFLNCLQVAEAESQHIKIMSYNLWNFNKNPDAAADLIRREQPDILLMQEISTDHFQYLIKDLNELYLDTPLQFEYVPEMKQAVISRFPILPVRTDIDKGRAQKVRIETSFGIITVINVHIFNFPWQRRHQQLIDLVIEDVSITNGPLILGGDFNTNDQSQAYKITKRYLKNAHWESGCGFGFTFPTPNKKTRIGPFLTAFIRIDHIFYSKHFSSRNSRTLNESGGSDHYPVITELIPKENMWPFVHAEDQ